MKNFLHVKQSLLTDTNCDDILRDYLAILVQSLIETAYLDLTLVLGVGLHLQESKGKWLGFFVCQFHVFGISHVHKIPIK